MSRGRATYEAEEDKNNSRHWLVSSPMSMAIGRTHIELISKAHKSVCTKFLPIIACWLQYLNIGSRRETKKGSAN